MDPYTFIYSLTSMWLGPQLTINLLICQTAYVVQPTVKKQLHKNSLLLLNNLAS